MPDPVPFEIVDVGDGRRVASNGVSTLSLCDTRGTLFRRRAIKGINTKPAGEFALPLVNELAGQLLAEPGMAADVVAGRIRAIADQVVPVPPRRVEWAVAELNGVRVYFDGVHVIVTQEDIQP
jgi:hypothetical protein